MSVTSPALDRFDLANEPVVESHHDDAACDPSHDHTLCAQAGANLSVSATGPEIPDGDRPILAGHGHRGIRHGPASGLAIGHPTRAPPIG
jgi:hypothetical protein